MSIRTFLFTCCAMCLVSAAKADRPPKKTVSKYATHKLMDKHVMELMANRVGFRKDRTFVALAEVNEDALMFEEELMFPADELYDSNWDTRRIDPFREKSIKFPDSCAIDCSSFVVPIDSKIKVTSAYGLRRRRMHNGVDLKVRIGDTIRAAFNGKVRISNFERRGYGNYLVIRHPNGLETVYGHLSKSLVDVNQIVRAGQPIALGGNTGRSTGSHLHFETRFLGQDLNPAEIIDFESGSPHQDMFVFRNVKVNGRNSNVYTSSNTQIAYYRVKPGDTLSKIARMYGTTVGELCRLNELKATSILRLGQAIRHITSGEQTESKSTNGKKNNKNNATSATTTKTTTVEATSAAVASLPENTASESETPVYHRVKSGDTLSAIAIKYGTSVSRICELNGISKTTVLKLGRSLRCS